MRDARNLTEEKNCRNTYEETASFERSQINERGFAANKENSPLNKETGKNTKEKKCREMGGGADCDVETADHGPDMAVYDSDRLLFTLKNDYLFKAVFQEDSEALRELLAVLLHKKVSDIRDMDVENPIILGETMDEKTVILDIRLTLNHRESVNIEMQVTGQGFWKERSMVYLCRNFGNLNRGETYGQVKPAIHIGILDFRLFPEERCLYSENVLKDQYTNRVYSDKLQLNVLSLRNIENATPKERASGLYDWAKLFAATTWEELKMAAKSEGMKSAVVTLRKLTADDKVRLQCEARERYETTERTWETLLREAEEGKALAEKELASAEKELASMEQERDAAREEIRAFYEMLAENPSLSAEEILKRMKS